MINGSHFHPSLRQFQKTWERRNWLPKFIEMDNDMSCSSVNARTLVIALANVTEHVDYHRSLAGLSRHPIRTSRLIIA